MLLSSSSRIRNYLSLSSFLQNFHQPPEGILMEKQPAIYIMTNKRNGTLYTGVTSDLIKRVYQHKNASISGFSRRYDCKLLVYYESHEDRLGAITREKQIKAGSRKKKIALIESMNPEWHDLYVEIL
jgi:putative endonuclease